MPADEPFATPSYRGGRFETGTGMPVDALPDLAIYAEILTDIANALFKANNPDRTRVSRGFKDRLQLRITEVRPGSQTAVLERPETAGAIGTEFIEARDLFADVVAAAAAQQPLPDQLPRSVLPKFSRLGQRLKPGEHIAFRRQGGGEAIYTDTVRRYLLQQGGKAYVSRVDLIGRVVRLDANLQRFELRTDEAPAGLTGPFGSHWQAIYDAMGARPEDGARLRVDADVSFDPDGVPQQIETVHDVVELDTWEWTEARLAELSDLPNNWVDGTYGDPPSEIAQDTTARFLSLLADRSAIPPSLFPTAEGGLQAEWHAHDAWTAAEITAEGEILVHTQLRSGADLYAEFAQDQLDAAADDTVARDGVTA